MLRVTGTYGCQGREFAVAAVITKSITIKGLGAGPVIDCGGSGAGLYFQPPLASSILESVLIDNIHVRNANAMASSSFEKSVGVFPEVSAVRVL